MIESVIHLLAATDTTTDIKVEVVDLDGDRRIRNVRLLSQHGSVIADESPDPACPTSFLFPVLSIPHSQWPLTVETTDCADEPVTTTSDPIPLLPPGALPGLEPRLPCRAVFCREDSACITAQAVAVGLRNRITALCTELTHLEEARARNWYIALAFFIAGTVLVAVGAIVSAFPGGQAAGVSLVALGAAMFALAGLFAGFAADAERKVTEKKQELRSAQASFGAAVADVSSSCCPGCISIDLSTPTCD